MSEKRVKQLSSENRIPSRGEIRIFTETKDSSKASSALTLVQSSYPGNVLSSYTSYPNFKVPLKYSNESLLYP